MAVIRIATGDLFNQKWRVSIVYSIGETENIDFWSSILEFFVLEYKLCIHNSSTHVILFTDVLESGFQAPGFQIPTLWILDSNPLDSIFRPSGFHYLNSDCLDSRFWPPEFQIPTSWIPDSDPLNSEFRAPWISDSNHLDSEFQPSEFWIPTLWILDSDPLDSGFWTPWISDLKSNLDSGFHQGLQQSDFAGFRIMDSVTWVKTV